MGGSRKERTVIGLAVDTASIPIRAATSKLAQKAYLSTFLFVTASLFLLGISGIAYILFYYNYVPQAGVERVIHLQFGKMRKIIRKGNPYGRAFFPSALTTVQAYDISLILHLPRTPNNFAAGNFMLDLSLLAPPPPPASSPSTQALKSGPDLSLDDVVLAQSRRPAILTYVSPIIETANTISALPWYILGWRNSEKEVLEVSMFEGLVFARGGWRNLPHSVKVVIEADEKMQFYETSIKIVAKFSGLRWILYHHRIFSFLFFTTAFWMSSMFSAGLAWLFFHHSFVPPTASAIESEKSEPNSSNNGKGKGKRIKTEPPLSDSDPIIDPFSTEDFSDTSRSFPTLGRQVPPLHSARTTDSGGIKREGSSRREEERATAKLNQGLKPQAPKNTSGIQQSLGAIEADDEDDMDAGGASWRDSGIGTSLDDGDRNGAYWRQRRRYTLDR